MFLTLYGKYCSPIEIRLLDTGSEKEYNSLHRFFESCVRQGCVGFWGFLIYVMMLKSMWLLISNVFFLFPTVLKTSHANKKVFWTFPAVHVFFLHSKICCFWSQIICFSYIVFIKEIELFSIISSIGFFNHWERDERERESEKKTLFKFPFENFWFFLFKGIILTSQAQHGVAKTLF